MARLRWAARLHDLGKIVIDEATLRKDGPLDLAEWERMRRHPRLSARFLLRFKFAAAAARAVEYHHERYDGDGYYAIPAAEVPLASHFLIVADSYDAMTSDRPYRRGLAPAEALEQIEAGSGTQFHPSVAKAFVAAQRGTDPLAVLTSEEAAALRRVSLRAQRSRMLRGSGMQELAVAGIVFALAAVGLHHFVAAIPGAVAALCAAECLRRRDSLRGRLAVSLSQALIAGRDPDTAFRSFVDRLAGTTVVNWAGVMRWDDRVFSGGLEREVGLSGSGPEPAVLQTWLMREHESAEGRVVLARGEEIGCHGVVAVAPIAGDGDVSGFVVIVFGHSFGSHVELALQDCLRSLSQLLPEEPRPSRQRLELAAAR